MPRPPGNRKLKAARLAAGYASQQALADALTSAGPEIGIRGVSIGPRQVRRWESSEPPWPMVPYQQLLTHVLGLPMDQLGFVPPWGDEGPGANAQASADAERGFGRAGAVRNRPAQLVGRRGRHPNHPPGIGSDFATVTAIHRRMYWTVDSASLHPAVVEHVGLGGVLLAQLSGQQRAVLAAALGESSMLAGRIEFFDLHQPDAATQSFVRGLQHAGEAEDSTLGAALLAHSAFVPGWAGDRDGASDRMAAARAHARRAKVGPMFFAWLDAVEAECMTRCGDTKAALALIDRAESYLREVDGTVDLPEWMDWFSATRLAAFKGNTQLRAGQVKRARETLTSALKSLPAVDTKQRAVVLGDLAAVEVAAQQPAEACAYAEQALEQLALTWYAAGMERIRTVRRDLRPWQDDECVRHLDDQLFGWDTTLAAVRN